MSASQDTAAVSLPDDLGSCHEMLQDLARTLCERDRRIAELEAAMEALINQRYAPKRERYADPDQRLLFGEPGEIAESSGSPDEDNDDSSGKKKRRGGKGRRLLDENVSREDLVHKLTDEQKVCPKCGAPLVIVLVNGLLQWAHRPAEIYGIQHVHEKGFCQCCHEHVVVADKPPQMIEKGAADASLLAHLTTSNKGDHLPTYRYEEISLRHGWWLPRSTQVGWLTQSTPHTSISCRPSQQTGEPVTIGSSSRAEKELSGRTPTASTNQGGGASIGSSESDRYKWKHSSPGSSSARRTVGTLTWLVRWSSASKPRNTGSVPLLG
ncbi:MAG: hypothetical protein GXX96_29945 [Planctomycetaceae bacterium]|mgnify:CR=1 FL=1|nr:hypothetical protein [Planctomycetaceae bacterium]